MKLLFPLQIDREAETDAIMAISLANVKKYRHKNGVWLGNNCDTFNKRDLTDTELTTLEFSDTRISQMMEILQVMPKALS